MIQINIIEGFLVQPVTNTLFAVFFIGVLILVLINMYKAAPPSQLLKSVKKRPWLSLGQILAAVISFPAFFSTVSFLVAITPEEALARGGATMPTHWEAGVMNHGEYYQWYTIGNHPFFFALSLTALVCSILFIWISVIYLLAHKKTKAACPLSS